MKAVVAAFNQEKALVGAFSVITNLRMEHFEALVVCHLHRPRFALLEAKLVVARVLHRFHVSAVTPPEQLQASLLAELVLRPKQGLHVTFSRRHPPL